MNKGPIRYREGPFYPSLVRDVTEVASPTFGYR